MAINAKFNYPDGKGGYTTFHFETNTKQITDFDGAYEESIKDIKDQLESSNKMEQFIEENVIGICRYPTQKFVPVYNGNEQTPVFDDFDKDKMEISGKTSATAAGTYQVTFKLNDFCKWEGGSTDPIITTWTIAKAENKIEPVKEGLEVTTNDPILVIPVKRLGGTVEAVSSDPSIASVESDGDNISILAKANGDVDITVTALESQNYTSAEYTFSITSSMKVPMENMSVNELLEIVRSGDAPRMLEIGDGVKIPLRGTFRGVEIDDEYFVRLIGIDHNQNTEGSNRLHFLLGKPDTGVTLAFTGNDEYGEATTDPVESTHVNIIGDNTGGWQESAIRDYLDEIKDCLPSEWANAITEVNKFSDNVGYDDEDVVDSMSQTKEEFFILSEFEIFGKNTVGNPDESVFQEQYEYFKNANTRLSFMEQVEGEPDPDPEEETEEEDKQEEEIMEAALTRTLIPVKVWTRSAAFGDATNFCAVNENGEAESVEANVSLGILVGFTIS